jgi:hypothetical protein
LAGLHALERVECDHSIIGLGIFASVIVKCEVYPQLTFLLHHVAVEDTKWCGFRYLGLRREGGTLVGEKGKERGVFSEVALESVMGAVDTPLRGC